MRRVAYWLSLALIFTIPWEGAFHLPGLGTVATVMGLVVGAFWIATVVVTGRMRAPTEPFLFALMVFTCWIALHDTEAGAGPVEYVRGSHRWPLSPPARSEFHAPDDWLAGPRAAAPDAGELDLVPVVVRAGGGSFHHGLTWHGSAPNESSTVARMALVSHMIPAAARFHHENVDLVYSRYRRRGDLSLDESFFPVLWDETGYRTPWLAELPTIE